MEHVHAEGGVVGIAAVDLGDGPAGGEALVRHFPFGRQEIAREGRIRAVGAHLDLGDATVRADFQGGRALYAIGKPEREDRLSVHEGLVQVNGLGKGSLAVVRHILVQLAGAGMEGVSLFTQGDVHAAVNAPQVGHAGHDQLFLQVFPGKVGRDDEIARHDDIGPVDHDVVDGAVEGLGLRVDIIVERPGIDGPGRQLDRLFLVLVQQFGLVGELQDRAGERLGAAPAGRHFFPALVGRHLPVVDLALDHRQRNEHQQGEDAHEGDFQGKGIFQFHQYFPYLCGDSNQQKQSHG